MKTPRATYRLQFNKDFTFRDALALVDYFAEIGTEQDFDALVAALKERSMGLILDFVPNHMGIGSDNPWWLDVLEWGESSPVAPFFDIDWDAGHGKVLLPVLGDQYGAILAKGEIELRFDAATGSI